MDKTILQKLAAFSYGHEMDLVPTAVIDKAKICLLDVLECCFSSPEKDARKTGALKSITSISSNSTSTIFGTPYCADAADAAFVNTVNGSITYRNDFHRASGSHPGTIVACVAFALGEEYNLSGEQVLNGIIIGYEMMIRLGKLLVAAKIPSCLRSTAISAPFAAAFAAAKTINLDEELTANAASLACHNAVGFNEWAWSGTGEDVFHAGWGARNGIQATRLAKCGVIASKKILEGKSGMLTCLNATDYAQMLIKNLGSYYYLNEVEFKPVNSCLMTQTPYQTACKVFSEFNFSFYDIESILITVPKQAKNQPGCDSDVVVNSVQAKMSIKYGVLYALKYGESSEINWYPPYDKDILFMMNNCTIKSSSKFSVDFPRKISSAIKLTMKSGEMYESKLEDMVSLKNQGVIELFDETLSKVYDDNKVIEIKKAIANIELVKNIKEITELLKK